MTNHQFSFSVAVGVAFIALGGVILAADTVGLSLIAVGAGIAALAVTTRALQGSDDRLRPAREPAARLRSTVTDY